MDKKHSEDQQIQYITCEYEIKEEIFEEEEVENNCDDIKPELISQDLKVHEKLYISESEEKQTNLFNCQPCDLGYTKKPLITHHMDKKHSEDMKFEYLTCEIKKEIFEEGQNENNSDEIKSENVSLFMSDSINDTKRKGEACIQKEYKCETCGKNFSKNGYLKIHRKVHMSDDEKSLLPKKEKYECEICGKKLSRNWDLKVHQKLHMTEEEKQSNFFKCPLCDLRYTRKYALVRHMNEKHSEEQQFAHITSENLKIIAETEETCEKKKHTCESCGKNFSRNWSLKMHQKVHMSDEEKLSLQKNYECDICGKILARKFNLKIHRALHMPEKKKKVSVFKCPYCDLKYTRKDLVVRHLNIKHSELKKRQFKCKICDKLFSYRDTLVDHQKTFHEKNAGFLCDTCGKVFPTIKSLRNHRISHLSGEEREARLFKCPQCDVKYFRKCSLKLHLISKHSQGRQFVCKVCGKTFLHERSFTIHEERHKEQKVEFCSICQKHLKPSAMKKHLKKHSLLSKSKNLLLDK